MKTRIIVIVLVLTGTIGNCFAQQVIRDLPQFELTSTDRIFGTVKVSSSNIKFDFLLEKENRMIIELYMIKQIDSLPDIDSLVKEVWKDLQHFQDSLNLPLVNRRIDYKPTFNDKRIRIITYPQEGPIYSIKNGEVTQLKVEQDTLRIGLHSMGGVRIGNWTTGSPYYITFLLNNITDLGSIVAKEKINPAVQLLKKDLAEKENQTTRTGNSYSAFYHVKNVRRLAPRGRILNPGVKKVTLFPPYVQTGVQYIRNEWAPSMGLGFDLVKRGPRTRENHYRLIWEPYFIFSRNATNQLQLDRNDFISFKYSLFSKVTTPSRQIEFMQTLSIGYLVSRKGSWFEPNSFKFSLPGLHTKNILLEPEFVFNKFFKNFSPSLKLVLYFD